MQQHTVELSDRELAIVRDALDRELSSNDTDRQDRAIELIEKLPEPSYVTTRGLQ